MTVISLKRLKIQSKLQNCWNFLLIHIIGWLMYILKDPKYVIEYKCNLQLEILSILTKNH